MQRLEYVFNKIIDMDNKANEVIEKTQEAKRQLEVELENKLKDLERAFLENSKLQLEEKRRKGLSEANKKASEHLSYVEDQCSVLKEKYNRVKDSLKLELVQEILES